MLYALIQDKIVIGKVVFGIISHPHDPKKTFVPELNCFASTSSEARDIETALKLNREYSIESDADYGEILVYSGKYRDL